MTTKAFFGPIDMIAAGSNEPFVFAGPTATVSTEADQAIVGSASASLGQTTAPDAAVNTSMCYQSTAPGSPLNIFGGDGNYVIVDITQAEQPVSAAGAVIPGAGTWNVGMCVQNNTTTTLDSNDYVNGWVHVVNSTSLTSAGSTSASTRTH